MSDYFAGSITGGRGSLTDSIDTGRPADLDGGRCRRMGRPTEVR
jgi:hypothetical protein